jgi:hypothetical protein
MKIIFLFSFLLVCSVAVAQSKFTFHSQNYIGVVAGEEDNDYQLQSINGFQKNTWFGGVGIGLDRYIIRSVPLFLSFTKYLSERQNSFYISVDGGTNFVWDNNSGNRYNGYNDNGKFTPSLYLGGDAGYRMGLKNKRNAILMNIGYSIKKLNESVTPALPCFNPPCPELDEKYEYDFRRISFKLGFLF